MDKNLQQRLAKVLDGNNKEAAWTMGRRYLSEETLYWAMEANYPSANLPDREYDVERFIEAWESNTDYEIVMPGDFEGKADIAVGRDYSMDCVKVTLYGASTEDGEPGMYAALLRHVADWIEKNAGAVCAREKADCGISFDDGFVAPGEKEKPEYLVTPSLLPAFVHGETYVLPEDEETAYGPYRAQRLGDEWRLLWVKPGTPHNGKVAMYTKEGTLYHASGQPVHWHSFPTVREWHSEDSEDSEWTMTEDQKKEAIVAGLVQGMQSGDTYCDVCDVCLAWGENIDISFDGRHDDNGDPIPTVRCEECAEKVIA